MMASFAFMCSSLFRNSLVALVTSFFVLYAAKSLVPIMSLLENQWENPPFCEYGLYSVQLSRTAAFSWDEPFVFSIYSRGAFCFLCWIGLDSFLET